MSLEFLDNYKIDKAILSLTAPGVSLWEGQQCRDLARAVNIYGAEIVDRAPERFGYFATLPLPDVDGSLEELAYSLDVLKATGVVVLSNIGDIYAGDGRYEPLWQELERREAIVFLHPNEPAIRPVGSVPAAITDFPFATTRAAVDLVMQRRFTMDSRIRIILPHAGGFLPFISQRIIDAASRVPGAPSAEELRAAYRNFYYDTALSTNPASLAALQQFAHPKRIVLGTDFPYAAGLAGKFTRAIEDSGQLSPQDQEAICRENPSALLGFHGL